MGNMQTGQQAAAPTDDKDKTGVTNTGTVNTTGAPGQQNSQASVAPTDDKDKAGTPSGAAGENVEQAAGTEVQGNKLNAIVTGIVDKLGCCESKFEMGEDIKKIITESEFNDEQKNELIAGLTEAVNTIANGYIATLKEDASKALIGFVEDEIKNIQESLQTEADAFLTDTANRWLQENKMQAAITYRTALAESFMENIKQVFEDHYVEVPDTKIDLYEDAVAVKNETEAKLSEEREKVFNLQKQLDEAMRALIFEQKTANLTAVDKERVAKLSESVGYGEKYESDLQLIVESLNKPTHASPAAVQSSNAQQILTEDTQKENPQLAKLKQLMSGGTI